MREMLSRFNIKYASLKMTGIKLGGLRNVTFYLFVFAFLLVLPVLLAFLFSIFGYRVSNIGASSLLTHNYVVAQILVFGSLSIIASGLLFHVLFYRIIADCQSSHRRISIKFWSDILIVGALFVLSYVGLLKSFPGTLLTVEYKGPTNVWLGVGAWSVICLLCIEFILTTFLDMRRNSYIRLLAISIIFLPVLLCGSRIDFLSCLLAELLAYLLVSSGKIGNKLIFASIMVLIIFAVSILVGGLRYYYGKDGYGALTAFSQQQQYIVESKKSGVIYLSTIGDIGTSVYQAVDARKSMKNVSELRLMDMTSNYSKRMLPKFLIKNRPHDIYASLGFNIGGGALHAFGEGYFFSGLFGVVCVGFIFGLFVSISFLSCKLYLITNEPLYWIAFIAPWILMIRGGWYQFFAIFKSLEILLVFFASLLLIRMLVKGEDALH